MIQDLISPAVWTPQQFPELVPELYISSKKKKKLEIWKILDKEYRIHNSSTFVKEIGQ